MRSLLVALVLIGCKTQAPSAQPVASGAVIASATVSAAPPELAIVAPDAGAPLAAPPPVLTLAIPSAATSPAHAPYDTSCQHDWDCIPAPTCCSVPCNGAVINVKDVARASADLKCDPAQHCISAGGCRTFQYLCLKHRCKLSFAGDKDFHERQTEPRTAPPVSE